MKSLAILGAVVAITATSAAHANSMPKGHDAGSPEKQGEYCWVYTNANGAGFWDRCDASGRPISLRGRENEVLTFGDGGAGGNR